MAASLRAQVRSTISALADLLVPLDCAGCGRAGAVVCPDCREAFHPRSLEEDAPALDGSFPVWGTGLYEGPVRRVLLGWKTGGRRDVERVLGPALADVTRALLAEAGLVGDAPPDPAAGPVLVVPAPSSPLRRLRGRPDVLRLADQVARAVAAAGTDALLVRALRHRASPRSWVGGGQRGRGQRARAVPRAAGTDPRGPVRARLGLDGQRVLVVDDVLTTGATLARCAAAVRGADGVMVGAVVVAGARVRGRRREPSPAPPSP